MLPIRDFKYNIKNEKAYAGFHWQSFGKVRIKFLLILAVVLFSLFSTQMVFASNLATDGEKLVEIETAIQEQERANLQLKTKIAKISSLSYLSGEAQRLGFGKPSKVITP